MFEPHFFRKTHVKGNVGMSIKHEPGIYIISNADYHQSQGISRSAISEFKKSPLHYWDRYINPDKKLSISSDAFLIGSAVHTLVLEPQLFDQQFIGMKKVDGRTKEGKTYKEEFTLASEGKQIIEEGDQMELINDIASSILDHPKIGIFLKNAHIEKSLFWTDESTGILCKSRPDIWNDSIKILCEIKTTNDASPESFSSKIFNYDYHIQAAMQRESIYRLTGNLINDFVFIAAPTQRPFKPYLYRLDEEALELGLTEFKQALKLMKHCFDINKWDYERNRVIDINIPTWAFNKNSFNILGKIYQCQN